MKKTYYITTPVYYPSNNMHIGHSYTTIIADTMSRYKKMRGFDVKFLTGTDEHGQKIERIAKEKNVTPIQYVDGIVEETKKLWELLDIEYDIFMRTSEKFHIEAIQKIFKKLFDKGDIYKSFYEGLYCTPCESFFTERQLVNGNCPDCNRQIEKIQEESYFFKLSNYTEKLLNHIEQNPDFITPKSRQNEMINNFLKPGLEDLCVSRTSITWGIPVTFDEKHVVYVWIDALSNYITALGYLSNNDEEYKKYWPADVHVVGKDIVRFHTIIWPAILMALDEPLPKQVYGHGFLVIDGDKMSKSKGNVVDPNILVKRYGVDAVRYFLMREIPFGNDGNFTNEALINRINSDLANDFGNLLSRTVGMIEKYFDGSVPDIHEETEFDEIIINLIAKTFDEVETNMDKMNFSDALSNIWQLISRTNKYIDETSPWIIVKDDSQKPKLARVMYVLSEVLRCVSILISPFMPNTPKYVHNQLNMNDNTILNWSCASKFGLLDKNITIRKGEIIFPRIDIEKEIESLNQEIENYKQNYNSIPKKANISIEEFNNLEIKVGKILECEKIKKSDKLLKSIVQIGEEKRQIVSGIAQAYAPEEVVGKSVLVVTNLNPVKLKGVLSEGMILCASNENGTLRLVCPDDSSVESGWVVK